jgi:expansin (peptidoglycan-binding protein)
MSKPSVVLVLVAFASAGGCDASAPTTADTTPQATSVGETHEGDYSLGPVAFSGSFWNACAPYTPELLGPTSLSSSPSGALLAGLALKWGGDGSLCDACILVKTPSGRSVVARVVTTGETRGTNDIDLSQAAFDAITSGEYPRKMTWELTECPATGKLMYQFQTEANPYWTSLWVRNARLPIARVEVKSATHPDFTTLTRGTDGTLTDAAGFGDGPFTLRVTAQGGQSVTDALPKIVPGGVIASSGQFD